MAVVRVIIGGRRGGRGTAFAEVAGVPASLVVRYLHSLECELPHNLQGSGRRLGVAGAFGVFVFSFVFPSGIALAVVAGEGVVFVFVAGICTFGERSLHLPRWNFLHVWQAACGGGGG